jgi:site-specific DNA recombinase
MASAAKPSETGAPWAIYCRVSTEDQAEHGVSLQAQQESCQHWMAARGFAVGQIVIEQGSGKDFRSRPQANALLEQMKQGQIGGVCIWRLDRWTRSLRDLIATVETCQNANAALVSVTESIDASGPMGRLVLHLLGSVAQFERESIGQRTALACQQRLLDGGWIGGHVPAGCQVVGERGKRRLERGPHAEAVEQCWQMIAQGSTLAQVGEYLRGAGVPGKWPKERVRGLIMADRVVGVLIDQAAHDAAAQALAGRYSPARKIGSRGQRPPTADGLLSGLLRCPACSASMCQVQATGHGGTYRYYRCTGRAHGLCRQKDLRAEPIETQAREAVSQILSDGTLANAIAAEALRQAERSAPAAHARQVAQLELDRATQQRDRIIDLMATAPSLDAARAMQSGLATKQQAVDRAAAVVQQIDSELALGQHQGASLAAFQAGAALWGQWLADEDSALQRAALRALVARVTIDGNIVEVQAYLAPTNEKPQAEGHGAGSFDSAEWLRKRHSARTCGLSATVTRRRVDRRRRVVVGG